MRKHIGLNKCSSNLALRNELGRLSFKLQMTMNILKVWIHLENQPPDSINKNKMAQENKSGLKNKINLLCEQININKNSVNFFSEPSQQTVVGGKRM